MVTALVEQEIRPMADRTDREARFPSEGVAGLGRTGLLGLTIPADLGGLGKGPREFAAVVGALAEVDPSLAMVYVMHVSGTACLVPAPRTQARTTVLRAIADGAHLTTLAFSEKGSRSHFWSPVSRAERTSAGVRIRAHKSWVTSAGHAQSYVVTTLSVDGTGPTDSTLYSVDSAAPGIHVLSPFDGIGLRGNASSAVDFDVEVGAEARLTEDGKGFQAKLDWVLPTFCLGVSALSAGIAKAAVQGTIPHLKNSRLEHLGLSLGEAYPTLRARLAQMQIEADGAAGRVAHLVAKLEQPDDATMLAVLETKAAANESAIRVTADAMRVCGGAAYSRQTGIDRLFRDAHAGSVMAPTVDQLYEFVGRALLGMPVF